MAGPSIAPPALRDRAEDTRRSILEVAAVSFATRGYAGTAFSDLIAETGLTKGAFYFHFPSKEALALAAFAHVQERWVSAVVSSTDGEAPAIDQLIAMLDAAVRFAEQERASGCIHRLSVELSEDPRLRERMAPYVAGWEDMVAWLIQRGQKEGDLRSDVDANAAARVSVAAFIGIQEVSQIASGRTDLRARAGDFLEFFMSGLRSDGKE